MARLLVVEDNPNYMRSLKDILEGEGYEVVGAPDGKKALEKARDEDFAVVIADLRLPGMNGIEVIKGINEFSPNTESLVLTGHPSDESIKRASDFGAYAYLKKTGSMNHAMMLVRKAVQLYEARQQLDELKKLTEELSEHPKGNPGGEGNPDGDEFKFKMIEWRGYVTRSIEDMDKRFATLDKDVGNVVDMVRAVDTKVGTLQIKVATMAGTAGVFTAIVTSIILKRMGG